LLFHKWSNGILIVNYWTYIFIDRILFHKLIVTRLWSRHRVMRRRSMLILLKSRLSIRDHLDFALNLMALLNKLVNYGPVCDIWPSWASFRPCYHLRSLWRTHWCRSWCTRRII